MDAVQDRLIVTRHVHTTEQLVDIMTKDLGISVFHYLFSKLGVRICTLQLEGSVSHGLGWLGWYVRVCNVLKIYITRVVDKSSVCDKDSEDTI